MVTFCVNERRRNRYHSAYGISVYRVYGLSRCAWTSGGNAAETPRLHQRREDIFVVGRRRRISAINIHADVVSPRVHAT